MRAGARRTKATIEQNTPTRSGSGEAISAWSTYKTIWCELVQVQGGEVFRSRQAHAEADYVAVYDYQDAPAPTTAMRLNVGGRLFDIKAIDNVAQRNREARLHLRERGA